ncbi:MAG: hypothetical protein HBSAPP04_14650 [Ignavibacteriaceae bacterium]|nr:MAG: hypothetical protein HBSAPP04_14650 [Ignavibacteriaceae bacterium]
MLDDIFGFSFDLTPEEIVQYLRGKGLAVTFEWAELWQSANNRAFTVSKMFQLDLLADVQASLASAVENGESFEQWKRKLRPELIQKGWWGEVQAKDAPGFDPANFPDQDGEEYIQLGSNRRMKTIFYTNRTVSYAQGRYKRLLENASARPFWMYITVGDERTRKSHAALDGNVWRFDDPVWEKIFPPNDWGCRCSVRALNAQDMAAEGLKLSPPLPDSEITKSVAKEWEYNAGASDLGLESEFFAKLRDADPKVQKLIIEEAVKARGGTA